ncbi:UNVERIFIED_CONTAM: SNARE-interacting protein KEULE [Sesamum calycinum]|uniref:SNARE-interacting protein KEULE n=1 Tax=Sesamum calycinum TaxID=2727403 RepID=A0AAW2LZU0_9LAMI
MCWVTADIFRFILCIVIFLSDMSGGSALYRKAFVFFSSPIAKELGFVTDNERVLEELFGNEESSRKGDACLNLMATRIATVFASLREFPFVRYRAAKSLDAATMTTFRDLIPTKLAAAVWNCLMKYKNTLPDFPPSETCELLILDRSIDQIPSKTGGLPEKKEVLLEDHDPVWVELRHAHIADASERLHQKISNFASKNKAVQIHGSRDGSELSTRDLQKVVHALPQYSEQIEKLSLHAENYPRNGLKEVGQLEQDLVFGDAGTKELMNFLRVKEDVSQEIKLRFINDYAALDPENFEDDKIAKLELARLPPDDVNAVYNMRLLEAPPSDTPKSSILPFPLKFDVHKKKKAARKDRPGEEMIWQLSRFYPIIEELIEKLGKGELPKSDYPCMNDPTHGISYTASLRTGEIPAPHSKRSKRSMTWAHSRNFDGLYSSDSPLKRASSDCRDMGRRIFVFIVGGATRSELRVCHKLSLKLKREIILGSSSLDDPPQFIKKMKEMTEDEFSLDDLNI